MRRCCCGLLVVYNPPYTQGERMVAGGPHWAANSANHKPTAKAQNDFPALCGGSQLKRQQQQQQQSQQAGPQSQEPPSTADPQGGISEGLKAANKVRFLDQERRSPTTSPSDAVGGLSTRQMRSGSCTSQPDGSERTRPRPSARSGRHASRHMPPCMGTAGLRKELLRMNTAANFLSAAHHEHNPQSDHGATTDRRRPSWKKCGDS